MIDKKMIDGNGSHQSWNASHSPLAMNPSISSLASWRTCAPSGSMRLAVNTGSSMCRYCLWSGPSRPSGIAGRSLPRYVVPCTTSWFLVTATMSAIEVSRNMPSPSCFTGHSVVMSTYVCCGEADALAAATAGSPQASAAILNT
ncbi:unannotated protein [freshwater metagenome]|uniref:Unannotated protein n=1 Tax=freshwater metagenome TaxID=449393 RepID=A0A6J7APL9_9ZZZZ